MSSDAAQETSTANSPFGAVGVAVLKGYRRRLAFATVMLAFVLEIVDTTIVNTALPAIQRGLGASEGAAQWIVTGYFLMFAVFLVAGGRLGDLYGYRRLFLFGVAGFTVASLACGLAPDATTLILARFVQGGAAAIMAPQVIALVQLMYSPLERVARLAVFGLVGGLAAIGGPILGGLLIAANAAGLGWRAVFLINLPVGFAALAAGFWLLPSGRSPRALRLDPLGTALLAAGLIGMLVPAIEGRARGWPWWCAALPVVGGALMYLFWRHSVRRTALIGSALIAPELFVAPTFRIGLSMTVLFGTATNGFLLVLSLMLQHGLGMTPLDTALLHMPFGLGVMAGVALIGPKALPRIGARLVIAGAATMALGLIAVSMAVALAPMPGFIATALALAGIGMGCIVGPLGPITLARVDRGHAGVAGGMHNGAQQIGGALGAAVVGTVFFSVFDHTGALHAFDAAVVLVIILLAAVALLASSLPSAIFLRETSVH
ncbi:MFS transporter [Glacieibacterium megasporae]|uniref:MFS transporter n=1 Tax=Glacieibacterium megasporae TaxID=2835787 RepID=UPI001C1DD7B9|nr:MFS transporter [Polymorphobacter megasporae]UAJ11095.1 MFS transporter [Polymorphobacter megasporae]